jgi:hypothetical protein
MDQHEADAEVGRLLREAAARFPQGYVLCRLPDECSVWRRGPVFTVINRPTPAEALRALLGEP